MWTITLSKVFDLCKPQFSHPQKLEKHPYSFGLTRVQMVLRDRRVNKFKLPGTHSLLSLFSTRLWSTSFKIYVAFIKHLSVFSGRSRDKCLSPCSAISQECSYEKGKSEAHKSSLHNLRSPGCKRQKVEMGLQKIKEGQFSTLNVLVTMHTGLWPLGTLIYNPTIVLRETGFY